MMAIAAAGVMILASCGTDDGPVVVTVTQTQSSSTGSPSGPADSPTTEPTDGEPHESGDTPEPAAPEAEVAATPAFGTKDIGPLDPISLMAKHGTLESVSMVAGDGTEVEGEITDSTQWTVTGERDYGETYTLSGTVVSADGTQTPFSGELATIQPLEASIDGNGTTKIDDPNALMPAYLQIPDGTKVGIAAPIIITFAGPVKDRAAAERRMTVTVDGEPIEGSWGWMADEDIHGSGVAQSRVHYRPKDYWPADADVHVEAKLRGVNYGSGWGSQNIVRDFYIGPHMVVKAEVDSHRLLVLVDDEIVKNYPVSYGVPSDKDPGRTTVSGIHVVQEKKPGEFEMCNRKYNYCGSKQYWGVRINNNGEFIHVNKQTEAAGILGKANVSHGCINMGMKDGEEFFNLVYYGVPVDVEGTGVEMGFGDYIWDWSVSYEEWKSFSALS